VQNKLLLILLMLCSRLCFAQVPTERLYEAWLKQDMSIWRAYLDSTKWSSLSLADQAIYINYEYGYVALVADDQIADDKEARIDTFATHLQSLRYYLPSAPFMAYKAAECAFRAKASKLDLIPMGLKAQRYVRSAFSYDKKDPFALTVAGVLDFYTPPLFGGSRTRAMHYFKEATKYYEQAGDTTKNWNYQMAKTADTFFAPKK